MHKNVILRADLGTVRGKTRNLTCRPPCVYHTRSDNYVELVYVLASVTEARKQNLDSQARGVKHGVENHQYMGTCTPVLRLQLGRED